MYQYSCRKSATTSKGLQLHSVLREFKKFQQQKQMLQNRINIMHNNQIKNNNKTKVIVEHLEKLKNIKTQYKQKRHQNTREIAEKVMCEYDKKKVLINKVKQQKKKIQDSKKRYKQFVANNYRRTRSQSRINSRRISQQKQNLLSTNRKCKQQIANSQSLARTKIQVFKNSKIESFREHSTSRLLEQIQINQSSKQQLAVLHKLQKQMVIKYSESIRSLKSSRTNLKRISPIRC